MASKNGNDNGSSQTPDTVVCESLTTIIEEKKAAESKETACKQTLQSKEIARGYKICCLDAAEETLDVYQDLMSCVTIEQYKKTEIIQKNIDNYIKKDDEIEKLIAESSTLLNDLCTKIIEANDELCTMSNCVKNKILSKSKKAVKSTKGREKSNGVEECLDEITSKNKTLVDKGKNAVESVITIAGIQTFTNTKSLKEFADELMTKMKKFKECTESNIKSTEEVIKEVREELNVIVEELAQKECDAATQTTTIKGLENSIDFICDCKDCDGECLDLCAEFEECCKKDSSSPEEKPSLKQMKDQN